MRALPPPGGARDLIDSMITDLGGEKKLTAGALQLVQRAALLGAIVADFETRWIAGESVPLGEYFSACNVQRRILATLGLERRMADANTLGDLLKADWEAQQAQQRAARAAAEASNGARLSDTEDDERSAGEASIAPTDTSYEASPDAGSDGGGS
jgi:hypothetical protein